MHLRLKFLSLTATTLVVSLGSPSPILGTPLNGVASNSQATQYSKADTERSTPNEDRQATRAAISSLTTAWKNQDRDSEAKALVTLGSIYNLRSENQNAIIFAQQGLKVAKENNNPTVSASSLLTLAGVHLQQGDYQEVIASTEEGKDYLQKLQDREAEAAASVMQGLAYLGKENYQQSIELAQQGLAISQEIKNPLIEALALIVLSLDSSHSGDQRKALELINKVREIAQEQNNRDLEALSLEVRGEIYRKAGQKEPAIISYQEALSIKGNFSAIAGLARAYQDANLLKTAITYYKQAVNKNEEQFPRQIPGLPVWLQESFPQAIQNIIGLETTRVYRSLATLLLPEQRIGETHQVLELLKGQELREYTGNKTINTTLSSQPAQLTMRPTEQKILKEYGTLISFGKKFDECQQTRCQDLEALSKQRTVLSEQYYQTIGKLETEFRKKNASDDAFVDPNQFALKAQEIVEDQPSTVLIYPLVLENKLWILWASKGGIFKSLEVADVSQTQLEETVLKFRQLLQNRVSNIDELKATSKQLYDWLIKPMEAELKANDIHNLVFALDRSTRYLPMATLFDGEKYLIENYSVSTVVSANLTATRSSEDDPRLMRSPSSASSDRINTLQRVVNRKESDSPLLPLGTSGGKQSSTSLREIQGTTVLALGVSESVGGFSPLPNVPAELDAIVRQDSVETQGIYPGQEFLNKSFNFFSLRDNAPAHQLLHIATHSKFVPGPANKSYLLLGTGEKLEVPQIETRLNLHGVSLAALSACQTALGGPGLDGREIAGVGYYFLKSGAKTVMASLWSVDDLSTRLLMEQFYKNLAKGTPQSPAMKAEALRQAQLTLLYGQQTADTRSQSRVTPTGFVTDSRSVEQQSNNQVPSATKIAFSHPYYWAPFILMGSSY